MAVIPSQVRAAKGAIALTALFFIVVLPVYLLAKKETHLVGVARRTDPRLRANYFAQHPRQPGIAVSAREQLRRRGSF